MCDVVVVGSCMVDLICYTSRFPKVGETLHGTKFVVGQGGKGANQCVAAAKLGCSTALVARLGNDMFGENYKDSLVKNKVNTDFVTVTDGVSSGMAQITVTENGDNQIVIVSGANNLLVPEDVLAAKDLILKSTIALFQFEIPIDTTIFALEMIKKTRGKKPLTIVNGAPALSDLDQKVLTLCDIFCVNESEAESVTGLPVTNLMEANKAVEKLVCMGCKTVILTLGSQGSVFNSSEGTIHVSVDPVKAVDTTGAGDGFLGALAFFSAVLSRLPLDDRIRRASEVARFSVMREGTQASYAYRDELPAKLFLKH